MESSVGKLEPFLLMAKSAKGAAAAKLVQDATAAPGVYVFGELLEVPSIANLKESETHKQFYSLLELFAYGTYPEYKQKKDTLPALNDAQIAKLKHLSLVSSSMQSRARRCIILGVARSLILRQILPYAPLLSSLDLPTVHALEQLIIDAIYSELLRGKLDQNQQQFEVEYTVGRDVPNDALTSLLASLEDWSATTSSLLSTLDAKLNSLSNQSAAAVREAEEYENLLNANLREIADKREKSQGQQRNDRPRALKENAGFARRGGDDDMDVDEPSASMGGGGAKGKNRKASQEISGKSRTKRNRT
ncbi:hypothetical protein PENSPDRAFT_678999 [Peniophora sp. CONT]|nr:hypothetical protein PENSPDRAFT_678999 [Peniophora sp. CONT]